MDKMIELLNEIYDLTVRQENAVNLGLVPRFMRLLDEKQEKLEEMEKIDIEKNFNMIYDEGKNEKVKELIDKINSLNDKNVEALKKQKKELKVEIEKLVNGKKVILDTYRKNEQASGHYVDNKK